MKYYKDGKKNKGMKMMNWTEWRDYISPIDEDLWQNITEKGLLKAEHISDYRLRLWFEEELDVSIYELDFHDLLFSDDVGSALLPLRDKERFSYVVGDYRLVWPEHTTRNTYESEIDLAPECVRFFCEKYGKKLK